MTNQVGASATRSDAKKNRANILSVAREAFGAAGAEPSMAEIARRANVGTATLYRHFPTRLDLVEELYRNQVDAICEATQSVEAELPADRFIEWLERFHGYGAQKGPLASLLLADAAEHGATVTESRARVIAAAAPLFAAAQREGRLRDDVSLGQVLDGVVAMGRVEIDLYFPGTMVQVLFDGLRIRPTR